MANPSTLPQIDATRRYFDQAAQVNRDLFALFAAGAEASLKTGFELQHAAFAGSQAVVDSSANLTRDSLTRWADVARQAQATALKTYTSSTKLFETLASDK